MTIENEIQQYDIGIIGLGLMGRNLALNIADHGFSVAAYNHKEEKIRRFRTMISAHNKIKTTRVLRTLCRDLRKPRAIMLLVSVGEPVDAVVGHLMPHLETGDLIIDGGNSHFSDTNRRGATLKESGLLFIGMGISGGGHGARHGPSLMLGGSRRGYERIKTIVEAVAARADGKRCAAYLGPDSAGHYVKMVHNGIEYGLMQLIAETYDMMKRGLDASPETLHRTYCQWNAGPLNSYLMQITSDIFKQIDDRSAKPLIDVIEDKAGQKGTGEWMVSDALQRQEPVMNTTAAVMMRHMSADKAQRRAAGQLMQGPPAVYGKDRQALLEHLGNGYYAAAIITYAQGMALLRKAASMYGSRLDPATIARIWRGGCIIRAAILEPIQTAYVEDPDLPNLLMNPFLNKLVQKHLPALRAVVRAGVDFGIPLPGMMSALAYFDAYRSERLPANLIMAQRDYFGAHGYERIDAHGTFHTHWFRQ